MDLARQLVQELYPEARAAWLGGSVVRGDAGPTSDLDITVLLDGPPAPRRKSLQYGGWPVELFVHTDKSLRYFADKDQDRRQPTMMRLVGESVVLVDTDGSGARLQQEYLAEVAAGPKPLSDEELQLLRELTAYDVAHGTDHATALLDGVRASDDRIVAAVDRILDAHGGRLFAGFELVANL